MEDHGGKKNFRRTCEGYLDLEANKLTAGAECVKALQSIEACKLALLNLRRLNSQHIHGEDVREKGKNEF